MPDQTRRSKPTRRRVVGPGQPDDVDKIISDRAGERRDDGGAEEPAARGLAELFSGLRKKQGLSQAELAQRIRTTQSAISEFESGQSEPRLSTLERYARALGYRLDVRVLVGPSVAFSSWESRKLAYPTAGEDIRVDDEAAARPPRAPDDRTAPASPDAVVVSAADMRVDDIHIVAQDDRRMPRYLGRGPGLATAT